jgi:predicted  nucleic acid-binding Zn-ribbon protein
MGFSQKTHRPAILARPSAPRLPFWQVLNTFRKINVFDFFYLTNAIGDVIIYIHQSSPLPKLKEIIHMAKHRSAFQLLQDAQKKISKLKERVAREVVSDHEDIKAFDFRILNVQKELTKVRRWTNEDNGLAVRITKLQAQIEKCREDLTNAESIQAGLETDISILKQQRKSCAEEILESQDIDIDSLIEQEVGE